MVSSEHFGGILVAFWCHFPFAALPILVLQHPLLHQNATKTTLKRYMKLIFAKNIEQNTIISCLKFKIVHCLYYKPLFTR